MAYRITVRLYYYTSVLLYYRITVLPYYCTTVLLYYRITVLPYYCTTVLLYHRITLLPYYCAAVLLYYRVTVLPYYCTWQFTKKEAPFVKAGPFGTKNEQQNADGHLGTYPRWTKKCPRTSFLLTEIKRF